MKFLLQTFMIMGIITSHNLAHAKLVTAIVAGGAGYAVGKSSNNASEGKQEDVGRQFVLLGNSIIDISEVGKISVSKDCTEFVLFTHVNFVRGAATILPSSKEAIGNCDKMQKELKELLTAL